MAEVLGTGTIELVADARKLRAGIEEAKKSIRTLGEGQKDISKAASASIDAYIGKLNQQNAALGKSRRETELMKLAMRGASNEQINAANSALKFAEAHEQTAKTMEKVKLGARALALAAVAAAAALGAAALSNIDFLDKLNDLSKSTGIAVEDLAGLSLLAKQTGTDLDGLAKGINKMSVEIGKSPEKFRELGITAKDSIGQFKQFADVFNKIEDISLRNALAQKVFSKSWQELAPAMSEGTKGITEAMEKGKRLSGITTQMAKDADAFHDKLEELKITSAAFGAEFIPILTKIVEWLTAAKEKTGEWIAAFRGFRTAADEVSLLEGRLKKLNEERAAIEARGPIGRLFSFDAANRRELDAATAQLEKLRGPAPELGSHLSAEQDNALQKARAAEAARLARLARGFITEGGDGGAGERKAQLALDLENIRKAGEARASALGNAERVMEAMRAASLVSDRDYYASKQAFIKLNAQVSEDALTAEIARLQKETFAGKTAAQDRLANLKAIADTQAKLNKARQDSATNATVTSIQEKAAADRLKQAYNDAKEAADQYIDTIAKRNQRELAGIGQGTRARENAAGLNEIEDKLIAERARIARDRRNNPDIDPKVYDDYLAVAEQTYRREVELYEQRSAAITAAESNWVNGAREALQNYADEAKNVAKQTEEVFTRAFQGLEDALVEFANTGKLNFKSLATSIASDLNRMSVKQYITGPLAEMMKGEIGGGGPLGDMMNWFFPKGRHVAGAAGSVAGAAGAAGKAAEATAFTTAVTTAGTAFTTAVTAAGTTLTTEVTAGGVTLTTEIATAGATFSAEVIAAGSTFAATVATAGATSAGAGVAVAALASGTAYLPQTGLYQLHQGERVIPAAQNAAGGGGVVINMPVNFSGPQNERSVAQGLATAGRMLRREVARGTAA